MYELFPWTKKPNIPKSFLNDTFDIFEKGYMMGNFVPEYKLWSYIDDRGDDQIISNIFNSHLNSPQRVDYKTFI